MCVVHSAIRVLVGMLCGASLAIGFVRPAFAQEDFFKPRIQPTPTIRPQATPQIFSFTRFESDFAALCIELEADGRRAHLVKIAEAGVAREKECITCRSFWKMLVTACGKLGPRPTPTPKPTKRPKEKKQTDEAVAPQTSPAPNPTPPQIGEDGATQDASASPTPTPTQKQERYPSVALLNETSRVSTSVYALDSGEGQVAKTFHYFAKTLRETPGMLSAEREYYDIFLTYLLAAWDGRVDRTKLPTPTPSAALHTFFE